MTATSGERILRWNGDALSSKRHPQLQRREVAGSRGAVNASPVRGCGSPQYSTLGGFGSNTVLYSVEYCVPVSASGWLPLFWTALADDFCSSTIPTVTLFFLGPACCCCGGSIGPRRVLSEVGALIQGAVVQLEFCRHDQQFERTASFSSAVVHI